ncbi:hypothetical protein BDV95DRAFT_494001 [Massariosphaeria phaeospora]|uniref:Beta-glucuronidase C-terminal domain-containing protein n=1 Tax=Massariosphaeria phaeospora TaxID=100035 RepID=A0A7C8M8W1_9PLEO|nr:hypothetical protein BDV95DRAFT_494001 [Massariosphaeria phaeospora]
MLPSLYFATLSLTALPWLPRSCAQSSSSPKPSLLLAPAAKASNAPVSAPLNPSFAGFGIEPSNLFSFTGRDEVNELSVQLMHNLADYAGAPPHIRLGGNTQDYFIFDASHSDFTCAKNLQSTAQGTIAADSLVIGPTYFEALERFPKDTPITFGLNLGYSSPDYIDKIVAAAQAAVEGMKNVKLTSFEIGNEPDLYLENKMRSGNWSGQTWTEEFLDRAEAVYNRVLKPAGLPAKFFEAPNTASTIGTTFEISMLVANGLLNGTSGNDYVSIWNQHDYFYFINVTPTPITLDELMDLDATNKQFAYWEEQVEIGLDNGLPYALREMSSIGPIGMHDVSDTFGAALWTLNFFMYTATLNISSVQMHMTDNSNASAWQPVPMYGSEPFVRAQYYAHAAVAQIVGNGNGTTQIGVLNTTAPSPDYAGRLRAFSAYANGDLQAMVLINSKQANASVSNKPSFTFELNLGSGNGNKNVFLSYLTANGSDSLTGVTWNGLTYANTDGISSVADDTVTRLRTSQSGAVSVPVRDSQAVVVNLNYLLGSGVPAGNSYKNSAAPTPTSGACTAALTGAATTTLALAHSVDCGTAEESGSAKRTGEAEARRTGNLWMMLVCLLAVMLGFVYLA